MSGRSVVLKAVGAVILSIMAAPFVGPGAVFILVGAALWARSYRALAGLAIGVIAGLPLGLLVGFGMFSLCGWSSGGGECTGAAILGYGLFFLVVSTAILVGFIVGIVLDIRAKRAGGDTRGPIGFVAPPPP